MLHNVGAYGLTWPRGLLVLIKVLFHPILLPMYHIITVLVPGLQAARTVSVRLIHFERFSAGIP